LIAETFILLCVAKLATLVALLKLVILPNKRSANSAEKEKVAAGKSA
jgi:hypothetical protein